MHSGMATADLEVMYDRSVDAVHRYGSRLIGGDRVRTDELVQATYRLRRRGGGVRCGSSELLTLAPTGVRRDQTASLAFTSAAIRAPSALAPARSRTALMTMPIALPPSAPFAAAVATSSSTIATRSSSLIAAGR